jgi:tetratricopeptide (TPR) repeat protein
MPSRMAEKARATARVFFGPTAPGWALLLLLALIAVLQGPALQGGFLFDDEPNLRDLGAYGGVETWETLRAYLFGGFAGPSGRPLSLLSFLIDDFTWPSTPENFKRTNLLLHLLNVALLAWATLKLTRFYGLDARRAAWAAFWAAAFWGLHPLLISTTFYVVQRMAMLAATFSLSGLVAYLHGRSLWPERPRAALTWMVVGLGAGTALATLSKENGALLPLLILVIEFCAPAGRPPLPRWFRWMALYLPSLALLAYLGRYINLSDHPWPERPFNQIERVLTEARILWDYLGLWFLPRIEGAGLFRDGIVLSRSLWAPPQTALAVAGLAVLLAGAVWVRRRAPFVALALLFFLAGHVMESGWLGLELYFEHRNYLPSVFLFLPLSVWLVQAHAGAQRALAWLVGGVLLAWLAFFSWQRAKLWADPVKLEVYWALAAPESPRAANALARHWLNQGGNVAEAEKVLDEALARNPNSGLLILSRLQLHTNVGTATLAEFEEAARRLESAPFDSQVVTALRHLAERAARPSATEVERAGVRLLIERLQANGQYQQFPLFRRLIPYLLARIALAQGDADAAERLYREAMSLYGQMDAAMEMVAEVGNAGHPEHALRLLDQAERLLATQREDDVKFPRAFYLREIERIRGLLNEERDKAHAPARAAASARS